MKTKRNEFSIFSKYSDYVASSLLELIGLNTWVGINELFINLSRTQPLGN